MAIGAVFFDVGGTLVDETRMFGVWADALGVSPMEVVAVLGATIEAREPHGRVFEMGVPGVDAVAARAAAREGFRIERRDLYADAAACLSACRAAGLVVGIAGNQPAAAAAAVALAACGLDTDHIATSEGWGVSKPDLRFFARIVEACGLPPSAIAYVGDRVDNDVVPARAAGMAPVLLARGPWGVVQSRWAAAGQAAAAVRGLEGLVEVLAGL